MIRNRYCLNNYECEMIDTEMCEDQKCVFWSTWSEWIKNFDGTRIDKRTRKCINGNIGDNGCKGHQSELIPIHFGQNGVKLRIVLLHVAKVLLHILDFVQNQTNAQMVTL